MKLIEVKDLEVGDEIIISCQSYFKYLRGLRKPALGTKTHWISGKPLYKSVKCSTVRITTQRIITNRMSGAQSTYDVHKWGFGPDDHNYEHYVDLSYRQIILVKKNEQ